MSSMCRPVVMSAAPQVVFFSFFLVCPFELSEVLLKTGSFHSWVRG